MGGPPDFKPDDIADFERHFGHGFRR